MDTNEHTSDRTENTSTLLQTALKAAALVAEQDKRPMPSLIQPSPLPELGRKQVASLEAVLKRLEEDAALRRASEASQRRNAIFANAMATIAAVMATIAAIPLIAQWLQ